VGLRLPNQETYIAIFNQDQVYGQVDVYFHAFRIGWSFAYIFFWHPSWSAWVNGDQV
jgi:hypothetical protein